MQINMTKANRKIILIRIIFFLLIIVHFSIIFRFSNQNGEDSGELSRKVTIFVLDILGQDEKIIEQEQIENIEHIIRKLAHFSIYMILGILLMGLMCTYKTKNIKRLFISMFVGILYASLDEFHQSFTPGRTALVTDVLIDTVGVIIGTIMICGAITIWKK